MERSEQRESRRSRVTLKVQEAATKLQRQPPKMEAGHRRAEVELERPRAEAWLEGGQSQTEP